MFSWSWWLLMLLRLKLVLHQTCNFFSGSSLVSCFSGQKSQPRTCCHGSFLFPPSWKSWLLMLELYFQFFSCSVDLTLQPSSHTSKTFQNSSLWCLGLGGCSYVCFIYTSCFFWGGERCTWFLLFLLETAECHASERENTWASFLPVWLSWYLSNQEGEKWVCLFFLFRGEKRHCPLFFLCLSSFWMVPEEFADESTKLWSRWRVVVW